MFLGCKAEHSVGVKDATRNKCIASSNKCLTSSNKKLLVTGASALVVVTTVSYTHLTLPTKLEV